MIFSPVTMHLALRIVGISLARPRCHHKRFQELNLVVASPEERARPHLQCLFVQIGLYSVLLFTPPYFVCLHRIA